MLESILPTEAVHPDLRHEVLESSAYDLWSFLNYCGWNATLSWHPLEGLPNCILADLVLRSICDLNFQKEGPCLLRRKGYCYPHYALAEGAQV